MRISRLFPSGYVLIFSMIAGVWGLPAARAAGSGADVFLGYSRLSANNFYPNVGGLNGWEGALHVKLRQSLLGVEGDVSQYGLGANSTVPHTTAVMGGPRVTVGALRIKAFVHALVGGEHSANNSTPSISGGSFTYALGGGVDVPVAPFFAWRASIDHFSAPTSSPGNSNHARFSTGIVFRF